MSNQKFVLITLAIVLFSGCVSKNNNYFSGKITPKKFGSYSLTIKDQRTGIENRLLKIPTTSFPWQADKISPILNKEELDKEFSDAIQSFITSGEKNIAFELHVIESNMGFTANTFSETESVNWRIELIVRVNEIKVDQSQGACFETRTSIDASHKKINEMYSTCFKSSVQQALYKINL